MQKNFVEFAEFMANESGIIARKYFRKNISEKFKLFLLRLCKISINSMQTPELWKKVIVRMISKKNNGKKDPKNYRPISME